MKTEGVEVSSGLCLLIVVVITALPSTGVNPEVVVATNEEAILDGSFSEKFLEFTGITSTFILPPSELPSMLPSTSPITSTVPSLAPKIAFSILPSGPPHPTLLPTSPTVGCTDDGDFKLNNSQRLTCDWVAKKKTDYRCKLTQKSTNLLVSFYCPATCNPDCITAAPTISEAPSFKPSVVSPCDDVEGYKFNSNINKGCDWVAQYPFTRCRKKDKIGLKLKHACPSVCNLRCTCRNSKMPFALKGKQSKCKNLRRKDCNTKAGRKGIVADFCPRKCKACYVMK